MKKNVFSLNFKHVLTLLSLVFLASSCKQEQVDASTTVTDQQIKRTNQLSTSYIPFADSLELATFSNDKQVIDYSLSRKLALLELDAAKFRQEFNWEGYDISEKPVLIYGHDSRPKYYEFVMLNAEGKPSGTVKTFAKKVSNGVLTEVRENVRDYQSIVSKSPNGMKFFEGVGNSLLVGLPSKSGGQPTKLLDTKTGKSVKPGKELTDEEKLSALKKMIVEESKQKKKALDTVSNSKLQQKLKSDTVSNEKQIKSLENSMVVAHKKRDGYWKEIDKLADSLKVLQDKDIVNKSTKFWGWVSGFFGRMSSPKIETVDASAYSSASKKATLSTGINGGKSAWCGPFALAWMHRAKYNANTDKYQYFENWASSIGGLNPFYQLVALFGRINDSKPMTPTEMCWSYLYASGFKTYITSYPCFGRDNAHAHIKYTDDPILILKIAGGELHWVVGWESKREKNWYLWDKHWVRINDNGVVGNGDGTFDYTAQYRASWPFVFLKVYE